MKYLQTFALLLTIIFVFACQPEEEILSDRAFLLSLDLEVEASTYPTTISGTEVKITRPLPFGTARIVVKSFRVSPGASLDLRSGDRLDVDESPISITVTAEDGATKEVYSLIMELSGDLTLVQKHGRLRVSGNKVVDQNNEPVSFAGNSFFWSNDNWGGERYYTPEVVSWLKQDWEATIVRAAMGVEDGGGYLDNKTANKNRLKIIVDAAIAEGIYVIIDWHSHHAEDHTNEAVTFFQEMATLYGEYDNVIYEIYNEPLDISWSNTLKPYGETVIAAIRAIDPDNMIIMGTPEWSQKVDLAAADPITDPNIAYTLHFYTVWHQQWLRDRATAAMNAGIAIFITEWGSIGYTQNDPETTLWMDWCKANDISHCNWAVNDKTEEWSILKSGASTTGEWGENDLTEAGKLARKIIQDWPE